MSSPQQLADTLQAVRQEEYVRFTAHWLTEASDLDRAPRLTGDPVVDALTAAAAGHASSRVTGRAPRWTTQPERALPSLWYPGPDALFANALTHTPVAFKLHGVLIERASLESV